MLGWKCHDKQKHQSRRRACTAAFTQALHKPSTTTGCQHTSYSATAAALHTVIDTRLPQGWPPFLKEKGPPQAHSLFVVSPQVKGWRCEVAPRHPGSVPAHRRTGTAVTGAFLAVVKEPKGPLEGPDCLVPLHRHRWTAAAAAAATPVRFVCAVCICCLLLGPAVS